MNENLDSNLKNEWEEKLMAAGLPSENKLMKREKIPVEIIPPLKVEAEKDQQDTEVEKLLETYGNLSSETKSYIVGYIKKMKEEKHSYDEILFTLNELMQFSNVPSDKTYSPSRPKDYEDTEFEKGATERVDDLISKMEKLLEENNLDNKIHSSMPN